MWVVNYVVFWYSIYFLFFLSLVSVFISFYFNTLFCDGPMPEAYGSFSWSQSWPNSRPISSPLGPFLLSLRGLLPQPNLNSKVGPKAGHGFGLKRNWGHRSAISLPTYDPFVCMCFMRHANPRWGPHATSRKAVTPAFFLSRRSHATWFACACRHQQPILPATATTWWPHWQHHFSARSYNPHAGHRSPTPAGYK